MKKKKKPINKSWILILVMLVLVILGFLLLFTNTAFWFKNSIHDDAKRYETKHCLVFYPDGEAGKKMAKQIASENKDDSIFDYALVPYGDYYLVNYGKGYSYFVDKDYQELVIGEVSDDGKKIIADYLRYYVKKGLPEVYYDANFLEESYIDNLSFEGVTYSIDGDNLKCRFPNYDVDVLVPLKYIQEEINMDFGYEDELYIKPTYIDPDHPVICLTFDDGPDFAYEMELSNSVSIVETLYKYDANATFYCIGSYLEDREAWTDYEVYKFLKESINNGNEYGSHTQTHEYFLDDLDTNEEIDKVINGPAEFFKSILDYDILTYRPPYGMFDEETLEYQDYPAILWCVDSGDWEYDDANRTYETVINADLMNGDIILFYESCDSTPEAIKKIVPELINQGYQLVTVSEMLKYEGIDLSTLKYYYNLEPTPYYE